MKESFPTLHPQSENGEDKIGSRQEGTLPEPTLDVEKSISELEGLDTSLEIRADKEAGGLIERGKLKLATRIEELGFGNDEIETGQKLLSRKKGGLMLEIMLLTLNQPRI